MIFAFLTMTAIVLASNYLVQFPINDWLTWGAFPYAASYLVSELTNRVYGPQQARRVAYAGFFLALTLSLALATPKIAIASGLAFLVSQLLDISLFTHLRRMGSWWYAPLISSCLASLVDSVIFWNAAFLGEPVPIWSWALGDTLIKLTLDVAMLVPFRFALNHWLSSKQAVS